jgi:NAD+ diphosphatase
VPEQASIAAQLRPQSRRVDLGPRPHLGYTASRLERVAERRTDAAFLAELEARLDAGAYAIGGEMVVFRSGTGGLDPLFTPAEARALAPARETVFLGLLGDAGRFGVGFDQPALEAFKGDPRFVVTDLRSIAVQGLVTAEHLPPLAEAKALLHWHARHRFCANCGAPSQLVCGGWKRDCRACKAEHFPRTDPVAIMLAVDRDRCLLGRQARFVPNMWSCLAGFVEPGESIEDAVRRETREEAGITCGRVAYLASQPWPFPMNLMIGCYAEAISTEIVVDRSELEDARWFDRDEVAAMLTRQHPARLATPPPVAIAHHIIRGWLEADGEVWR